MVLKFSVRAAAEEFETNEKKGYKAKYSDKYRIEN